MRNLTPSRLRTSATAAAAFMVHSPGSGSDARDCAASGRESVISYARPAGRGRRKGGRGESTVTRDELKRTVDETIERHADEIIEGGETIRRHPELGFKESRTAALVESKLRKLGLTPRTGLALTGVRADVAGGDGPGPTFALLGELDSLVVAGHPEADPTTGAVHACGHNAQIAGLVGAAIGLVTSKAMEHLAGRVAFLAVPAEEGGDLEWRPGEARAGALGFLGGKCELLRLGQLDDVGLAMMIHTTPRPEDGMVSVPHSNNGRFGKRRASSAGPLTPAARPTWASTRSTRPRSRWRRSMPCARRSGTTTRSASIRSSRTAAPR